MPIITEIQAQKYNEERMNLFVDGQYFMSTTPYIIKKFGLEKGKSVDPKQLEEAILEDSYERAKNYIVDYHLSKSTKMIREKLKLKEYDEGVISKVMDFLERYQLVNDSHFANHYSHDSFFIRKKGKNVIKQTLKQKGITNEDIEKALERISVEDESFLALRLLRNKIESYAKKSDHTYELKQKCFRFLTQKGFSSDITKKAIEQVLSEFDFVFES